MHLDTKKVLAGTGLQRNYLWEFILPVLTLPNGSSASSISNIDVSSCCQKVKFGDYNMTDLLTRKAGPFTSNSAGSIDIGTVDATFLNTTDAKVIQYFQDWKDMIIDPSGFYNPKAYYAFDAFIFMYDTKGDVSVSYVLKNMFPKTFPSFSLDYEGSTISKFEINFSIDQIVKQ